MDSILGWAETPALVVLSIDVTFIFGTFVVRTFVDWRSAVYWCCCDGQRQLRRRLSDPLSDFLRAAPAQHRPGQSYQISVKYLIKYLWNILSNIFEMSYQISLILNISLNIFLLAAPARCRDQSYQVVFVWVNKVFSLWQFISLSIISFSKSNYQYPPLRSVVKAIATVNIDWVSERNQLN